MCLAKLFTSFSFSITSFDKKPGLTHYSGASCEEHRVNRCPLQMQKKLTKFVLPCNRLRSGLVFEMKNHKKCGEIGLGVMLRKNNSIYFHSNDKLDQLLVKSMRTLVDEKKVDPKGKFITGAYFVLEQMLEKQYRRGSGGGRVGGGFSTNSSPKTPLVGLENGEIPNVETDRSGQPNNTTKGRVVPSPSVNAGNSEGSNRRKRARPSNIGTSSDVTELKPIIEDAASSLRSVVQESDKARKQRSMILLGLEMIEGLTMDQVYDATIRFGTMMFLQRFRANPAVDEFIPFQSLLVQSSHQQNSYSFQAAEYR
ncbi:hypothetical protein LINPERHAP2_LOCUS30 [Linum perenne]